MKRILLTSTVLAVLSLSSTAWAVETEAAKAPAAQQPQRMYGSQLMTQQERIEYRAKMRAAKSADERAMIRKEHHEKMKLRAKERGVELPENPPVGRVAR
ncbi:MAG: hypothetical protein WC742_04545 [Gallionellaceae bacterium]|jgi:hypothetical protein